MTEKHQHQHICPNCGKAWKCAGVCHGWISFYCDRCSYGMTEAEFKAWQEKTLAGVAGEHLS